MMVGSGAGTGGHIGLVGSPIGVVLIVQPPDFAYRRFRQCEAVVPVTEVVVTAVLPMRKFLQRQMQVSDIPGRDADMMRRNGAASWSGIAVVVRDWRAVRHRRLRYRRSRIQHTLPPNHDSEPGGEDANSDDREHYGGCPVKQFAVGAVECIDHVMPVPFQTDRGGWSEVVRKCRRRSDTRLLPTPGWFSSVGAGRPASVVIVADCGLPRLSAGGRERFKFPCPGICVRILRYRSAGRGRFLPYGGYEAAVCRFRGFATFGAKRGHPGRFWGVRILDRSFGFGDGARSGVGSPVRTGLILHNEPYANQGG